MQQYIPNAISRLSTNLDPRTYDDLSGMGPEEDIGCKQNNCDNRQRDNVIGGEVGVVGKVYVINNHSLEFFPCHLVEHFTILFGRNKVKWPQNKVGNCPK